MKRVITTLLLLAVLCASGGSPVSAEETGAEDAGAVLVMPGEIAVNQLSGIVDQVYARDFWLPDGSFDFSRPLVPVQIKASDLSAEERADFLYWYISNHYAKDDPRVQITAYDVPAEYAVSKNDAGEMLTELIGTAEEADLQSYFNNNCSRADETFGYVYGQTGGQYPGCRFSEEKELQLEDGRLKIIGKIITDRNSEGNCIIYCIPQENGAFDGYAFDELIVDTGDSAANDTDMWEAQVPDADAQWLNPDSMWATSVHYTEGVDSYEPQRINDGDVTTGWVEGVDGPGIGEFIELSYPEDVVFRSVYIVPGFCKREDLFYRNNAPVELEFSSGGKSVVVDTSSSADNYYVAVDGIVYGLPEELPCDGTLRVTIRNVRPGTEWDDTVISELHMIGRHQN